MSDVSPEANEADIAEQQTPLVPDDDGELRPDLTSLEANEADIAEQGLVAGENDEDDYRDG